MFLTNLRSEPIFMALSYMRSDQDSGKTISIALMLMFTIPQNNTIHFNFDSQVGSVWLEPRHLDSWAVSLMPSVSIAGMPEADPTNLRITTDVCNLDPHMLQ